MAVLCAAGPGTSTSPAADRHDDVPHRFATAIRQVELYHNADGKVYCLLEGPDEEAIRKHHAALDVPCGDVHQVNSLL
jgi:hypothetical protein